MTDAERAALQAIIDENMGDGHCIICEDCQDTDRPEHKPECPIGKLEQIIRESRM